MAGNTLLFSEILDKVHKAKTNDRKVANLRENNTDALRMVLKSAFDPKIEWVFPDGEVPYTPNDAPEGAEHTVLAQQPRRLRHFIKGADKAIGEPFIHADILQMCEGLHKSEAELLVNAKDKKLHQVYKGLSTNVVKEAFGWNDEFKTV